MRSISSSSLSFSNFKKDLSSIVKQKAKASNDTLPNNIKLNKSQSNLQSCKIYFVGAQDCETSSNYFLAGDTSEGCTFTSYA